MPVVTVAGGKKDFSSFLLILPFLSTITKEKKENWEKNFSFTIFIVLRRAKCAGEWSGKEAEGAGWFSLGNEKAQP